MSHHGSMGRYQGKECYFMFTNTFLSNFFLFFFFFFEKMFVFLIIFIYFFWWSINSLQQNLNQSEIGIGDKKLRVVLHVTLFEYQLVHQLRYVFWMNRSFRDQDVKLCTGYLHHEYIRMRSGTQNALSFMTY